MKFNPKEILVPTVTLFLICVIITGLLSGTNLLTKDVIAAQEAAAEQASRSVVLPTAASFEERQYQDTTYYAGLDGSGQEVGYVINTSAKGYGGDISVMTGIGADGKVQGVVILSQNETPGLGANAEKESFRSQYQQQTDPQTGFSVIKSGTPTDGQISAITGATITSRAVTDAVNEAVQLFYEVVGVE